MMTLWCWSTSPPATVSSHSATTLLPCKHRICKQWSVLPLRFGVVTTWQEPHKRGDSTAPGTCDDESVTVAFAHLGFGEGQWIVKQKHNRMNDMGKETVEDLSALFRTVEDLSALFRSFVSSACIHACLKQVWQMQKSPDLPAPSGVPKNNPKHPQVSPPSWSPILSLKTCIVIVCCIFWGITG